MKKASLPQDIVDIAVKKNTEPPFTGLYCQFSGVGTYICRACGVALYRSDAKFNSGCGWPSFDQEISGAVLRVPDPDGVRTEIVCSTCSAHLGHVFSGENMTAQNTRHCVNSLSLDFIQSDSIMVSEEAIFAAGCFWGVQYLFDLLPGVLKTEVGYSGGHTEYPTYEEVCSGKSEHLEAIRVIFDPDQISFAAILKYFFEIHDCSQIDGQGPDLGAQYSSAIFYYDEQQRKIAGELMSELAAKGLKVATRLRPVLPFFSAETYHQKYYSENGGIPYCHRWEKKF